PKEGIAHRDNLERVLRERLPPHLTRICRISKIGAACRPVVIRLIVQLLIRMRRENIEAVEEAHAIIQELGYIPVHLRLRIHRGARTQAIRTYTNSCRRQPEADCGIRLVRCELVQRLYMSPQLLLIWPLELLKQVTVLPEVDTVILLLQPQPLHRRLHSY